MTHRKVFWIMLQFCENLHGIANLVSLIELEKDGWSIQYQTGNIWEATSQDGKITLRFMVEKNGMCKGMPYINLANPDKHIIYNESATKDGMVMVETLRNNYEGFTKEQVMRAAEVRDAMAMMAHPSEEKFKKHVVSSGHAIKNFSFTLQDVANANALFGPDRGSLKGKTVRQRQTTVMTEN